MIYLDNAATTLRKPKAVSDAVLDAMQRCASIGRSGHVAAMAASETVFFCRQQAAKLFDAMPEQIVFTMNATHGLNLAIHTLVKPGDRVVISGFEHNAVLRPLYHLNAEIVIAQSSLFSKEQIIRRFEELIDEETKAVICTHVSNVFGFILPVEEISQICRRRNVPLIIDASQSAGILPVSTKRIFADFIAMPGHKALFGPQGTGILVCRIPPLPILQGGTGSRSMDPFMPEFLPDVGEAGTHNVHGIAGLAAGISYILERSQSVISNREETLMMHVRTRMNDLPEIVSFIGQPGEQTGVVSFLVRGEDCEDTAYSLAQNEIAVRAGLHCSPLAHKTAGTFESGTVRLSLSDFTTIHELDVFFDVLKRKSTGKIS